VFSLLAPAKTHAVVPVFCPSICETWDVALSGHVGDSPKRWFATKEIGPQSALTSLTGISGIGDITSFVAGLFQLPISFLKDITGISNWDAIAWFFARLILLDFSEGIVEWIRTGQDPFFSIGTAGTLFTTNIDDYILHGADNAASIFLSEYFGEDTWNKLCTPFKLNVGLGLSRNYGRDLGTFKFQAACTITDIVDNLESYYVSFFNGGWPAFLSTARYENTPFGLLSLSRSVSESREARKSQENKLQLQAGQGFIGVLECVEGVAQGRIIDPQSEEAALCNKAVIKTPGKSVVDYWEHASGAEIKKLADADEVDEVLVEIFSNLFAWLISGGGSSLLEGSTDTRGNEEFSLTACNDGRDNDNDSLFDMNDPGCTSPDDDDEFNVPLPAPQCGNGIDDDGDGLVDMADPDCTSALDPSESDSGLLPGV